MKTRLVLEIETKDMKKFVPEQYILNPAYCPKEEECTGTVESLLHSWLKETLTDFFSDEIVEILEGKLIDWDESPEGIEQFSDFGKVTISLEEDK